MTTHNNEAPITYVHGTGTNDAQPLASAESGQTLTSPLKSTEGRPQASPTRMHAMLTVGSAPRQRQHRDDDDSYFKQITWIIGRQ